MSNGKVMIVHLVAGLKRLNQISVILSTATLPVYKNESIFREPYEPFGRDINVKVDLFKYATKTDIKNISHVNTSSFALKSNLASLKAKVDKLDIDKLAAVSVELSKLSDAVKNDVKKAIYDKLVAKVNSIDTSRFVLKTKYNTDKKRARK